MTYQESLAYIESLESRGWKLGLERTRAFLDALDLSSYVNGSTRPQYYHVAGTNGKGSTTAYLQHGLFSAQRRTGAFFSPFVVDMRERVQIGLDLISREDFARHASGIRSVAESFDSSEFGPVTEFEYKTAIGFRAWRDASCEAIALEVGLGGRLDSTNVVDPTCSIIVSIGMDHMHILGDTLESIAAEKAGIIKTNRPLVLGAVPKPARNVILAIAEQLDSPVWKYGKDIWVERNTLVTPAATIPNFRTGMFGVHQLHNAALAAAALQLGGIPISEQVLHGIATASAPGRFEIHQVFGKTFVFDGAHNADSAIALAASMEIRFPGRRFDLVTGMLRGHEVADVYSPFRKFDPTCFVTPIDNPRARGTDELGAELSALGFHVECFESVDQAMEAAGKSDRDLIVVTGSFYLVGEALKRFAR